MTKQLESATPSTVAYHAGAETSPTAIVGSALHRPMPCIPGYEILGELGRGGMGVVYRAKQLAVQRIVALKMVLDTETTDAEFVARFRAEAEAAARLQHPHIVQLYEFGEVGGRPYFSLELVGGGSLADRLQGEPQPFEATADLIATLADAMHYAHGLGVVHRDLKPANILMTESGVPKIADFGLAKRLDIAHGHTVTGAVLGTPSYMPPEQAAGHKSRIGPAVDVYALGAILYECITGRPPFRGSTPLETILQVAHDDPVPPRRLRPETPRDLETICLRCLARHPARRYSTAQALADDLRRFRANEPIAARPATVIERFRMWARRHPARAAAFATVSSAAVFLLALGIRHNVTLTRINEQLRTERQNSHLQLVRATLTNGWRLADEGDFLGAMPYFVEALRLDKGSERESLHRIRIGAVLKLCPELLNVWSHEAPVTDAAIRPDRRAVASLREDGSIRLWNLASPDQPAKVFDVSRSGPPVQFPQQRRRLQSFDPTGRWLAVSSSDRVFCVDTNQPGNVVDAGGEGAAFAWLNGAPLLLLSQADSLGTWNPNSPHERGPGLPTDSEITAITAPDVGDQFATGHRNGKVRIWKRTGWQSTVLSATGSGPIAQLHFRPDGQRLLIVAGSVAQVCDVFQYKKVGLPLQHAQEISDAVWSPDGATVATGSIDDTVRLWDAETGQAIADPFKHGSDVFRVAFSPNGKLLASCGDDDMARVWNTRAKSAHAPPLPHNGSTSAVGFAADSRTLFSASEDGTVKLWRVEPAEDEAPIHSLNSELPQKLTMGPNGRWELRSTSGSEYRVFDTIEKRWVSPEMTHPGGLTTIDVSPNGDSIVTGGNDRTARIWDWKSGRELTSPLRHGSRVADVAFSPDGKFVGTASDDNSARVWDAATGEPKTPLLWLNGGVKHIRFSLNSSFILTASKGPFAFVWEIATGELVAPVRTRDAWIREALKSRRSAIDWQLEPDPRSVEVLSRLAQWLSGQRFEQSNTLVPLSVADFDQLASQLRQ